MLVVVKIGIRESMTAVNKITISLCNIESNIARPSTRCTIAVVTAYMHRLSESIIMHPFNNQRNRTEICQGMHMMLMEFNQGGYRLE